MTDLVTGDTGTVISFSCVDKETGAAIQLGGATANIHILNASGPPLVRAMAIIDALSGIVSYQFQASDIQYPAMSVEVTITDSAGFIITTSEVFALTVREQLA